MTKESPDWRTEARRRWQQLCAEQKLRHLVANEMNQKTQELVAARDQARDHLERAERTVMPSRTTGPDAPGDHCAGPRDALAHAERRLAEHLAVRAATVPSFDGALFNEIAAAVRKLDQGVRVYDHIGDVA